MVNPLRGLRVGACAVCMALVSVLPASATTWTLDAAGSLQATLDAAQPGDVILLAAGATYTGNFVLPLKGGSAFITIRTNAAPADLPAAGVRTTPTYAPVLAKIRSPNASPALTTAVGAHHYRIENVEFPSTATGTGDIIVLGASSRQTQIAQMPSGLVFDRVYVHGDPVLGQKRGIALNSGDTQIINSYISDIKAAGQDSQAICGWNGSGPFLIQNNYLEAAGENLMFGGADPSVPGLVPADITIRGNLLSKPDAWRGSQWSVKNALELKNARRVLIEGNVIERVWKAAQAGYAVVFTPRNQDGTAPWSVVEDVTLRYNIIRHAAGAINMTGWDDERSSAQTTRVQIADNLIYDIDGARWGGSGVFLQVGNSPRSTTVERNTVIHTGTALQVYGSRDHAPWVIDGFVFRDNLLRHNTYGVKGDDRGVGLSTLSAYFSNLLFDRNVLAGGSAANYPSGNYFPSVAEFQAAFTNMAAEDFSLVPGNAFRTASSHGGLMGADVGHVVATTRGLVTTSAGFPGAASGEDVARCRSASACADLPASARRRFRGR